MTMIIDVRAHDSDKRTSEDSFSAFFVSISRTVGILGWVCRVNDFKQCVIDLNISIISSSHFTGYVTQITQLCISRYHASAKAIPTMNCKLFIPYYLSREYHLEALLRCQIFTQKSQAPSPRSAAQNNTYVRKRSNPSRSSKLGDY